MCVRVCGMHVCVCVAAPRSLDHLDVCLPRRRAAISNNQRAAGSLMYRTRACALIAVPIALCSALAGTRAFPRSACRRARGNGGRGVGAPGPKARCGEVLSSIYTTRTVFQHDGPNHLVLLPGLCCAI